MFWHPQGLVCKDLINEYITLKLTTIQTWNFYVFSRGI